MLKKMNKRGEFVSLFVATIIIFLIIIGFFAISVIVKNVENIKNGEKIYKDGEVGVGDINNYMKDYECLVKIEKLIGENIPVDDAISTSGCSIGVGRVDYDDE